VQHCLSDIGYRFRPYLLKIAYERRGRYFADILPVGAAVELLQISSLVIDDFCDSSSTRNGQPSVVAKWGSKAAVTIGVLLSSEAFALLADSLSRRPRLSNGMEVVVLLQRAHSAIYSGQFDDLRYEGRTTVSEAEYLAMISKTTAEFLQASLVSGAMLRGASERVIGVLNDIGMNLGLAYQLRDDVIDLIADPECTGKPAAGDVRERKMRLPVIHALSHLDGKMRNRLAAIFRLGRSLTKGEVQEVLQLLNVAGSIEYAIRRTGEFCRNAEGAIRQLPSGEKALAARLLAVAGLISKFEGEND
jgi:geranylgeranyl pyrophosphate synthase